jgi:hypothetical protein
LLKEEVLVQSPDGFALRFEKMYDPHRRIGRFGVAAGFAEELRQIGDPDQNRESVLPGGPLANSEQRFAQRVDRAAKEGALARAGISDDHQPRVRQ